MGGANSEDKTFVFANYEGFPPEFAPDERGVVPMPTRAMARSCRSVPGARWLYGRHAQAK